MLPEYSGIFEVLILVESFSEFCSIEESFIGKLLQPTKEFVSRNMLKNKVIIDKYLLFFFIK